MLRPVRDPGRLTPGLFLTALVGFALTLGRVPPDPAVAAGFDPTRLAVIDQALEQAVADWQIPGGVVLVFGRDREALCATAGYRDGVRRRPVERTTLFRVASMTKPVTAVAALILVDEGKLGLDDPVSRFLPEFGSMNLATPAGDRPATRPVRVRHLLNHTAGLGYRFSDPPGLGDRYVVAGISDGLGETPGTVAENVQRLARLPLLFEPGTAWHYGLSSDVLGRVVEVASGLTLDRFFQTRVFDPLRMVDTHFLVPEAKRDRLATLFTVGPDGRTTPYPPGLVQQGALVFSGTFPTWDSTRYHSGGAGLVSTADDYARFLRMLLRGGELDGVRILRPETARALRSDQCAPIRVPDVGHGDAYGFGVGVVTAGQRYDNLAGTGTFGWAGFFHTFFWADPDRDLFAVFLSNIHPAGHLAPLRDRVKRAVYEARMPAPP